MSCASRVQSTWLSHRLIALLSEAQRQELLARLVRRARHAEQDVEISHRLAAPAVTLVHMARREQQAMTVLGRAAALIG